jgi:hypothetical protein
LRSMPRGLGRGQGGAPRPCAVARLQGPPCGREVTGIAAIDAPRPQPRGTCNRPLWCRRTAAWSGWPDAGARATRVARYPATRAAQWALAAARRRAAGWRRRCTTAPAARVLAPHAANSFLASSSRQTSTPAA